MKWKIQLLQIHSQPLSQSLLQPLAQRHHYRKHYHKHYQSVTISSVLPEKTHIR